MRGMNAALTLAVTVTMALAQSPASEPQPNSVIRVHFCDLSANPDRFDGKVVAFETYLQQAPPNRVFRSGIGICEARFSGKEEWAYEVEARFPAGLALEKATAETQEVVKLFEEFARYKSRTLRVKVVAIGTFRIAPPRPPGDATRRPLYFIEISRMWEM